MPKVTGVGGNGVKVQSPEGVVPVARGAIRPDARPLEQRQQFRAHPRHALRVTLMQEYASQ